MPIEASEHQYGPRWGTECWEKVDSKDQDEETYVIHKLFFLAFVHVVSLHLIHGNFAQPRHTLTEDFETPNDRATSLIKRFSKSTASTIICGNTMEMPLRQCLL